MAFPVLSRPIVFFDLETTGLVIDLDKIIEIGLLKIFPDGKRFGLTQRFDPGIKIPVESFAIHGISNMDLFGQPRFKDKAAELFEIFKDSDLGGFAMRRLDIPMLTKEFKEAGFDFSMEGRRMVDVSIIFREMERRNLSAAYRFYLNKELVGAHGAEADNLATLEVFQAQLDHYPDLPRDIQGLHDFCNRPDPSAVDQEGKLVWRDAEAFFNFGKYKGKSLASVVKNDPGYLDWVRQQDFPKDFVEMCIKAKQGIFPKPAPQPNAAPSSPV